MAARYSARSAASSPPSSASTAAETRTAAAPSSRAFASTASASGFGPEAVLGDIGDVEHRLGGERRERREPRRLGGTGLQGSQRAAVGQVRVRARQAALRVPSPPSPPAFAALAARSAARSTCSRSASSSSVSMVSMSSSGDTRPDTWATSPDSKQRTTCAIARVSRHAGEEPGCPVPLPSTRRPRAPAISTNSIAVGTTRSGRDDPGDPIEARIGDRDDSHIRLDGAERIVSPATAPALVSALYRVDLPTFGSPTIPHWRLISEIRHPAVSSKGTDCRRVGSGVVSTCAVRR